MEEWPTIRELSRGGRIEMLRTPTSTGSALYGQMALTCSQRSEVVGETEAFDLRYPGRKRYGPSLVIKTAASKVASMKPTRMEP